MDDRSTVPIVRQPSKSNTVIPLREEQQFFTRKNRSSHKIKTTKRVSLKLETPACIEVTTKRYGTILVDPYQPSYNSTMCIVDSGADSQSDQPFLILVATFCDQTIDPVPHYVVSTTSGYQKTFFGSPILHTESFGLIPDDRHSKF